jgi:hypothetical protein
MEAKRRGRSYGGTCIRFDTQISGKDQPLHPESVDS